MAPPNLKCSLLSQATSFDQWTWNLEANPDISGTGVLIGFMASAYISFIILLVYYFTECPISHNGDRTVSEFDASIIRLVRNPSQSFRKFGCYLYSLYIRRRSKNGKHVVDSQLEESSPSLSTIRSSDIESIIAKRKWKSIIDSLNLSLSDQQMITGIAILVAGITQLDSGISFYHWNVLTYLAWFSSLTHLSVLTMLRDYFRVRMYMRMFRLFIMATFAVLLLGTLFPLLFVGAEKMLVDENGVLSSREVPLSYPTRCLYRVPDIEFHIINDNGTFLSMLVLIFGYTSRAIKLFDGSTRLARTVFRIWPSSFGTWILKGLYRKIQMPRKGTKRVLGLLLWAVYGILSIGVVLVQVAYCIFQSLFWELLWLTFALSWGTINLFRIRNAYKSTYPDQFNEERKWGFGQWISPLLLILPLISIFNAWENYRGKMEKARKRIRYENFKMADFQHTHFSEPLMIRNLTPTLDETIEPLPPQVHLRNSTTSNLEEGLGKSQNFQSPNYNTPESGTWNTISSSSTIGKGKKMPQSSVNMFKDHWLYTEAPTKHIWFRHLTTFFFICLISAFGFILVLTSVERLSVKNLGKVVYLSFAIWWVWGPILAYMIMSILYQNYIFHVECTRRRWKAVDWCTRSGILEFAMPAIIIMWQIFWAIQWVGFPIALENGYDKWLFWSWSDGHHSFRLV